MDIDIDTQSSFSPRDVFSNIVQASMVKDEKITKHPVGVYFQNVPQNPLNGLSAIPYERGEEFGLFKIDFLHLNVLDNFSSKQEIRELLKKEPNWELLTDKAVVNNLFQIKNQFEIINLIRPKSVQSLADCIALIRPGKRFLLESYLKQPDQIRPKLYEKTDKYYFKKGHAISYALTIVLQLHAIEKQQNQKTQGCINDNFEY